MGQGSGPGAAILSAVQVQFKGLSGTGCYAKFVGFRVVFTIFKVLQIVFQMLRMFREFIVRYGWLVTIIWKSVVGTGS